MRYLNIFAVVIAFISLSGCSSLDIKRTVYDFMSDQTCLERVGHLDCEATQMSFEEYQRERIALITTDN